MKSLDTILAEAIGKMKPATKKKFAEQTRGERISQESLINIAEGLVAEDGEDVRESRRITRNNGAQRDPQASDPRAESDAMLMEAIGKRDPAFAKAMQVSEGGELSSKGGELSSKDREEVAFCRAIGLSEAEALKVVKSGCLRS